MIEWIEKERRYNRTNFDGEVIISHVKRGHNKYATCIKFRKNSFFKIAKDEESIVLARDNAKIYFKEAGARNGFKLRDFGDQAKMVIIPKQIVSNSECGEYNLEFDSDLMLHYINLYKKLEKELNWEER